MAILSGHKRNPSEAEKSGTMLKMVKKVDARNLDQKSKLGKSWARIAKP